jgi:Uma2 family endonuclease
MRLGDDLPARQPDDFVILPDRVHMLTEQGVGGPANLVVEVVTAGYEYVDYEIKFREYERGGVQEYWIIDPERQETLFYILGEDGLFHSRLPEDGVYTSSVLPRLKLSVKLLLQEKPPTTLEAVRLAEQMLAEA